MKVKISNVASLPTRYGEFFAKVFDDGKKEHLVLFSKDLNSLDVPLLRIHSECLTGDAMGSLKCDCGEQLERSLQMISEQGGVLIYHRQEGRNIGLFNKINAYALQDKGLDTIEANHQLGFKADERTYEIVEYILKYFKIKKLKLIKNNPSKVENLKEATIVEILPIRVESNRHNKKYLKVKKEQMGHML